MTLLPVAILAGGLGTRLGERVRDTPKPLLEVAGEPFLFHQLRLLRSHGARRVVICVGYLGERIEAAVGDGSTVELEVACSFDEQPGTAAALRTALPLLGEAFLVVYGDTYLRIDYADVQRAFRGSGLPALMTVFPWEGGNALYADGIVSRYEKESGDPALRWVDYGLAAYRAEALAGTTTADLAQVQHDLAVQGLLAGYPARERFFEIGTEEALRETDAFLRAELARHVRTE